MPTSIYVGNISYATTEEDLRGTFFQFGNVERVKIVTDPYTEQSRGFAFVDMTSAEDAQNAISQLHGTQLHGRILTVNEARPKARGGRRDGGEQERRSGRYQW